jgi:XTP/dITP diphosphohydrolase
MTSGPTQILIATSNEGKVREITRAFTDLPLALRTLRDFPFVRFVEEIGETYEENAISKAIGYSAQTGLYAVADDSGLEVDALDGDPGFFSARYGGGELAENERNLKLLSSLAHIDINGRAARFVSVVVLAEPLKDKPNAARVLAVTKGVCEGTIAFTSQGAHGFGYDSIFIPNGHDKTFGELPDSVKNRISHRAQSLLKIRTVLKELLEQT